MTLTSTGNTTPILQNRRLRPGTYKIQNLYSKTFLDIHQHSKELCCRPTLDLEDGGGLWEIRSFGGGHTVQKVDPGNPEKFCTTTRGLDNGTSLHVTEYPAAWRIEVINVGSHRGFRFYWGPTQKTWNMCGGQQDNGNKVVIHDEREEASRQTWTLIPVEVENTSILSSALPGTFDSSPLPSYNEGVTGQFTTRTQRVESERDDLDTIVNEVTVVTTHKRYRVPGP